MKTAMLSQPTLDSASGEALDNPLGEIEWVQSRKLTPNKISFLDLPRELRNIIYDFAFRVSGVIFIYCLNPYVWRPSLKGKIVRYKDEGPSEPLNVASVIPIGLMGACRQTHAEAAEVLYTQNVFRLHLSTVEFAPSYAHLVRHITFTTEAGRGIYNKNLEVMSYWWRRVFWPNLVHASTDLLHRYPNLESLVMPIKSDKLGETWRPAFLIVGGTKMHRIALAARWLGINCPMEDERLRQVLQLEIMPSSSTFSIDEQGPSTSTAQWDESELAEAFQEMKSYLMRQEQE